MGDNYDESEKWIGEHMTAPTGPDIQSAVGKAVFTMAGLLTGADHSDSVLTQYLDIKLADFLKRAVVEKRNPFLLYRDDLRGAEPRTFFLALIGSKRGGLGKLSDELAELMEPAVPNVDDDVP